MDSIVAKPRWLVQSHSDLQRHEGFRKYAYPDPLSRMGRKNYKEAGKIPGRELMNKYGWKESDGAPWTVGYGFTHGVTPDSVMTINLANQKLYTEIKDHVKDLEKLVPKWKSLPMFAQSVLVNMIFNLGYDRLKQFKGTLDHVRAEEWDDVAKHLESTLWYKQVGDRAKELVWRMRNQRIQSEYIVPDFSGVSSSVRTTAVTRE